MLSPTHPSAVDRSWSNAPASRRGASGFGGYASSEAAYCQQQALRTSLSSGRRSSDTVDWGDSSRSQSPAASTTSATTSLGGWSEGSNLPSPDAGRQYLQLLTQTKPHALPRRTYQLIVIQQPYTAAEFGRHDMSRIPLAPPLFVQLIVRNSVGAEVPADNELPFLVARITLHAARHPPTNEDSSGSNLYGTTIAAPHSLRDMDGVPGAYFVFPDVGVRRRGRWRLYVSLLRLAHVGSATLYGHGDTSSSCLASVWTESFDVLSADGYVAPQCTALTRHFQNQGVRMFISNSVVPR